MNQTYSQESEGHRSNEFEDGGGLANPHLDQKRETATGILDLLAGDGMEMVDDAGWDKRRRRGELEEGRLCCRTGDALAHLSEHSGGALAGCSACSLQYQPEVFPWFWPG